MAFQATTLQMLISCPGDIEQEDLAAVRKAITRWNVLHGEAMEHTVIPVHWSEHASAEFGEPAQTVINRQLVDTVDVGIALFWGRLGTPTATAESGTAEEIVTLHDAGKPVSVLRCTKPIAARGDHTERARLDDYLREEIQPRGLIVDYPTAAALEQQVDTILMRLVRTYDRTAPGPVAPPGGRRGGAHIVASIHREQVTRRSSKGQIKESTRRNLVLTNSGGTSAREIDWEFVNIDDDDRDLPGVGTGGSSGSIPSISAGANTSEVIHSLMGSAQRFLCRYSWLDGDHLRQDETTLIL
jgi:hypothetical protein